MNPTHLIIFNRAPAGADGEWIHIVPKGELPNREAGVVQVLDDIALGAILRNIQADQARLGDRWPGIYAGREHFIYNAEQDSAALAWFKDFQQRPDGLWAKRDGLTPAGQTALANKEYKFTSFVADRRDTQDLGNGRLRILKLDTIGFTNQANGKELLTPITNRNSPAAACATADQHQQHQQANMKSIATKLGLSAEASEQAVLDALTPLLNRAEITPDALKTLRDQNVLLLNRNTELEGEQIETLLDVHGVKDAEQREALTPALAPLKNRADRVTFLTKIGFAPGKTAAKNDQAKLLNRSGAKTPTSQGAAAPTTAGAVTPELITTEVRKLMNRDGIKDFTIGYNALLAERPDLFARTEAAA